MTTSKHSPGPWTHHITAGDHDFLVYPENGRDTVALVYGGENEANARLIAAAPELLAALRALTATARTFRNVPKSEQEWTPLDDEALAASFAALAMVQP
jgi:hypothetical protein